VNEPLVAAARLEQPGPGLCFFDRRHA
jgi:hypothetical protein